MHKTYIPDGRMNNGDVVCEFFGERVFESSYNLLPGGIVNVYVVVGTEELVRLADGSLDLQPVTSRCQRCGVDAMLLQPRVDGRRRLRCRSNKCSCLFHCVSVGLHVCAAALLTSSLDRC